MSTTTPLKTSLLKPYIDLSRISHWPHGAYFVFWPAAFASTMAAHRTGYPPQDLALLSFVLFLASTLVHAMICTMNDIWDRNIDAKVERSKSRPLPSGAISFPAALLFLAVQYAACIAMLQFLAHPDVMTIGLITLFPLHGLYPLMKRVTYWPQIWLGLSGAGGSILAWKQVTGSLDDLVLAPMTISMVCWTILYDVIYASQDRTDDIKAGVFSAAVLFGSYIRELLALFAAIFVMALTVAGYMNDQGPLYYIVGMGSAAVHVAWQVSTVDFDDKRSVWERFLSNGILGWYIWAGMLADYAVKWVFV